MVICRTGAETCRNRADAWLAISRCRVRWRCCGAGMQTRQKDCSHSTIR